MKYLKDYDPPYNEEAKEFKNGKKLTSDIIFDKIAFINHVSFE